MSCPAVATVLLPAASDSGGIIVTVRCQPTWPEGSFGLQFSANAGTGECTGRGDKITSVTVNKLPTVDVQGPKNKRVCAVDDTLTLDYDVLLTNVGQVAATLSPSICTFAGGSNTGQCECCMPEGRGERADVLFVHPLC